MKQKMSFLKIDAHARYIFSNSITIYKNQQIKMPVKF